MTALPVEAQVPERLASLVPSATEVLFAIGAGDRVVAVGDFDDFPPEIEDLPRIGGLIDPNLEAILAARPDLVVIDPAQRALASQLAAAGIDTYEYATAGIDELLEHMRALGELLDVAARSEAATLALENQLAAVREAVAGRPRPTALVVFGRRPGSFAELWVNGGQGALHELLETAGGTNVFAEVPRQSFKSGLEGVIARAPDVIVEAVVDLPEERHAAIETEWRALPGFGSVRVVVLAESWMLRPGPRIDEVARQIAAGLHAEAR